MSAQTEIKKYFKSVKMLKGTLSEKKGIEELLCNSNEEHDNSLMDVPNTKRTKFSDTGQLVNCTIKEVKNSINNSDITLAKNIIRINQSHEESYMLKNNTSKIDNESNNKLLNIMILEKTDTENVQECNINNSIGKTENLKLTDSMFSDNTLDESEMLCNYQTVFLMEIIDSVLTNDNNKMLFTSEENKQISDFINLSNKAKNFCARLFFRKNSWYRLFDFIKSIQLDVSEKDAIILTENLRDGGFIFTDYSNEDPEVMLNLFNVMEIKQLYIKYKLSNPSKMNKNSMIRSILKNTKQQTTLLFSKSSVSILHKNIKDILKTCVQLSDFTKELFLKFQLLYSLTNTMLKLPNDLYRLFWDIKTNKVKFPTYLIDQPKIFINIEHFNRYHTAYNLRARLEEAITLKDTNEGVYVVLKAYQILNDVLINPDFELEHIHLPKYLHCFTTGYNLINVVSKGIDILKTEASGKHSILWSEHLIKKKEIIKNIFNSDCLTYMHICEILSTLVNQNIYLISKKGLWYEQLSLINNTHLNKIEKSAYMILMAFETELLSEVYQLKFSHRAEKLVKASKLSNELKTKLRKKIIPPKEQKSILITASAVPETLPGHKRIYVQNDFDGKTYAGVEQIAINHYNYKEGYEKGIHCEGTTVVTLFGLLFWDIIYEYHVPNTFITTIQDIPLDLYSSEFYQNRKVIIDDRLNQLINENDITSACHIMCNNIVLHSDEKSILNKDLCKAPEMLTDIVKCMGVTILGRICERLLKNFGLSRAGFPDLLVWSLNKKNCKFVEVKGQHDTLSEKQILWLEFLTNIGADVEVCHVHTTGTKKSQKISALIS